MRYKSQKTKPYIYFDSLYVKYLEYGTTETESVFTGVGCTWSG